MLIWSNSELTKIRFWQHAVSKFPNKVVWQWYVSFDWIALVLAISSRSCGTPFTVTGDSQKCLDSALLVSMCNGKEENYLLYSFPITQVFVDLIRIITREYFTWIFQQIIADTIILFEYVKVHNFIVTAFKIFSVNQPDTIIYDYYLLLPKEM